jgi:predicted nucleic acid-binding protein
MTEVNYDDSKARIDEKVGTVILKNIIFACIITNEFEKANKYLTDFKSLRLSYDDKQFADNHEKMAAELKSRFDGK